MTEFADHDSYIAAAPPQFHEVLNRLRAQLRQALPDAAEVIKYNMPGFQIDGVIVAGYAAFSKQCGLYVHPQAISSASALISELKLNATKSGVTFSTARPISDELINALAVESRAAHGLKP